MEMTAERFRRLWMAAGAGQEGRVQVAGDERRDAVRIGAGYRVTLRAAVPPGLAGVVGSGGPVSAWVRDISASGIGLTCRRLPWRWFSLELPSTGRGVMLTVPCELALSCVLGDQPDGGFEVGARFLAPGALAPRYPTASMMPMRFASRGVPSLV